MKSYGARLIALCVMSAGLVLGAPTAAQAQNANDKLAKLLPNLYLEALSIDRDVLEDLFGPLTNAEFNQLLEGFNAPAAVNVLLGSQVAAFPLGSSAGGFTWTFDPALGTFNRVSQSFGPIFSERALTVGKGRFNLGFNYQRSTFDELQGLGLRDNEVKAYAGVTRGTVTAFFEEALNLKLTSDTYGFFATYGVTKSLDLGVAIPIVHVDMQARLDSSATVRIGSSTGTSGTPLRGDTVSDSATGLGDIVLRGKYNLWSGKGGGLAAGLDLRLPTADEEDLLGVAGAQSKIYAAFSSANGRISPHVNIGYTFSGESSAAKNTSETFVIAPPNEFGYAGGVDVAVTPKLTLVGDLTGRTLIDSDTLSIVSSPFGANLQQLAINDGSLNLVLGSVGVKYNVFGTSLISANFLFPLNKNGLTDHLTWLIGFERSFSIRK